jgi:peptidoglycan/LPS O-acetylase OafA/YrhL
MVAQQRHALFNLSVALAALIFFVALIPLLGVLRAQGGFCLLGISALAPLFWRSRKGKTSFDERDRLIFLRATQIAFAIFWLLFVGGVLAAYYSFRNRNALPINLLPLVIWLGWSILLITHSTALLVLYQKS